MKDNLFWLKLSNYAGRTISMLLRTIEIFHTLELGSANRVFANAITYSH